MKVLNELSLRGCLGILIACLQDSDLEVVKKAIFVVDKMLTRLNKYNFVEVYNKGKKTAAVNIGPSKLPVLDSNYSEFDRNLTGAADPVVRNNADNIMKRTEISVSISNENGETCPDEMIIESIVKADDLTLLANTCKSNLNLKCDEVKLGQIDEHLFKKYATVSPDEFISFVTKNDLKCLVDSKSEWLQLSEDFSSLLDDVLRSFGNNMDLDCY